MDNKNTSIDMSNLEKAVKILKDNDLGEIEYIENGIKIKVVSASSVIQSRWLRHLQTSGNISSQNQPFQVPDNEDNSKPDLLTCEGAITSPMVGTCYLAPEPGAKNFVEVGDIVKKDQPLLIIEAMKVMNYIKSPRDGKIINISVKDSQPVEYGQLLLVIE